MTNTDYTHLALIVDRSGSMSRIANDMNGAITELLRQQAKLPGTIKVDAWTFDDHVEHRYVSVDPTGVVDELVVPRGSTALNDAIASSIVHLGERFAALPEDERPGKVVVAIVTDGEENSSKEYPGSEGRERVKAMVEKQRDEYAWEFLFFGASSIDAFAAASGYGVGRGQTISFDQSAAGVGGTVAAASAYLADTRSGLTRDFTDAERKAAAADDAFESGAVL